MPRRMTIFIPHATRLRKCLGSSYELHPRYCLIDQCLTLTTSDLNLEFSTPHTAYKLALGECPPADMARFILELLSLCLIWLARAEEPKISAERVVFQIAQGDIEFAFFPEVMDLDHDKQTQSLI